jgi:hypothetical protein
VPVQPTPLRHRLEGAAEAALGRPLFHPLEATPRTPPIVREAQEVKRAWRSHTGSSWFDSFINN